MPDRQTGHMTADKSTTHVAERQSVYLTDRKAVHLTDRQSVQLAEGQSVLLTDEQLANMSERPARVPNNLPPQNNMQVMPQNNVHYHQLNIRDAAIDNRAEFSNMQVSPSTLQNMQNNGQNRLHYMSVSEAPQNVIQHHVLNGQHNFQNTNHPSQNIMTHHMSNSQLVNNELSNAPIPVAPQMNNIVNSLHNISYSSNGSNLSQNDNQFTVNNVLQQPFDNRRQEYVQIPHQNSINIQGHQFMGNTMQGQHPITPSSGGYFVHPGNFDNRQDLNRQQNYSSQSYQEMTQSTNDIYLQNNNGRVSHDNRMFNGNEHFNKRQTDVRYQQQTKLEVSPGNCKLQDTNFQGHRPRSNTQQRVQLSNCKGSPNEQVHENYQSRWNQRDQDSGFDSMGSRFGDNGPRSLNIQQSTVEAMTMIPSKSTEDVIMLTKNNINANQCSPTKQDLGHPCASPSQILPSDGVYPQKPLLHRYEQVPDARDQYKQPRSNESNNFSSLNQEELRYEDLMCDDDNLNNPIVQQHITQNGIQNQKEMVNISATRSRSNSFNTLKSGPYNIAQNSNFSRQYHENNGVTNPSVQVLNPQRENGSDLYIQEFGDQKRSLQTNRSFRSSNVTEECNRNRQVILTRGRDVRNSKDRVPGAGEAAPSKQEFTSENRGDNNKLKPVLNQSERCNIVVSDRIISQNGCSYQTHKENTDASKQPLNGTNYAKNDVLIINSNRMSNTSIKNGNNFHAQSDAKNIGQVSHCDGLIVRDRPLSQFNNVSHQQQQQTSHQQQRNSMINIDNTRSATEGGQRDTDIARRDQHIIPNDSKSERTRTVSSSEETSDEKHNSSSVSWMEWTQQLQVSYFLIYQNRY